MRLLQSSTPLLADPKEVFCTCNIHQKCCIHSKSNSNANLSASLTLISSTLVSTISVNQVKHNIILKQDLQYPRNSSKQINYFNCLYLCQYLTQFNSDFLDIFSSQNRVAFRKSTFWDHPKWVKSNGRKEREKSVLTMASYACNLHHGW